MYNVHVWHDCRRKQYTPRPSLSIILPERLFVLFGEPLRGGGQYRQPMPTVVYTDETKAGWETGEKTLMVHNRTLFSNDKIIVLFMFGYNI